MPIRFSLSRPRRWLILLALLAALPLPSAAAARPSQQMMNVCGTPEGNNWFEQQLSFAPLTIAPGVLVEPLPPEDQRLRRVFARLSNSTNTPLYLVEAVADPSSFGPKAAPISLDGGLAVRQRVVAGRTEDWSDAGHPFVYGWAASPTRSADISLIIDAAIPALPGYRSQQRDRGARPTDVALPPSASYELRVIYGTELFIIPVADVYRINPRYDTLRSRDGYCDQSPFETLMKLMLCIVLPILSVLGFGLYGLVLLSRRFS